MFELEQRITIDEEEFKKYYTSINDNISNWLKQFLKEFYKECKYLIVIDNEPSCSGMILCKPIYFDNRTVDYTWSMPLQVLIPLQKKGQFIDLIYHI